MNRSGTELTSRHHDPVDVVALREAEGGAARGPPLLVEPLVVLVFEGALDVLGLPFVQLEFARVGCCWAVGGVRELEGLAAEVDLDGGILQRDRREEALGAEVARSKQVEPVAAVLGEGQRAGIEVGRDTNYIA